MAEYLSNTHTPGADGVLVGVPGDQGLLYDWMRVLAGGGTSEFSAIRMRGPIVLADNTIVDSAGFAFESFIDGTVALTWAPAVPIVPQALDDTSATAPIVVSSGGLVPVAGNTVIFRNEGAGPRAALVTYTVTLSGEAPPGGGAFAPFLATLVLRVGGVTVTDFKPQAELRLLNVPVTVTGQAYVANWAVNADIAFLVESSAADTRASVQFASVRIELV